MRTNLATTRPFAVAIQGAGQAARAGLAAREAPETRGTLVALKTAEGSLAFALPRLLSMN